MALHIQMSEEAERILRRKLLKSKLSAIAACLAFISIGGVALYLSYTLILGNEPPSIMGYEPPPSNKPPTKEPKLPELSSKSSPPSANLAPPVIIANSPAPSTFAPADMPTSDIGTGSQIGLGEGFGAGGLGDGLGEDGGGMGSGEAGGSTLVGTFYDLKLTKNGATTGITPGKINEIRSIYKSFFEKGWREKDLAKYYRSPQQLYASNFFLPVCHPQYAPAAFQCSDKVKPSAWAVIYRGRVRAPKSGNFRFVGVGDDVLAVRFNRKTVLETGYVVPSDNAKGNWPEYRKDVLAGKYPDKKDYEFIKLAGTPTWNSDSELGGFTAGTPFKVKEGEVYDIEIFISEIPGGKFGFVLLIDDMDDGLVKNGKKIFDIFRTNFSEPNKQEIMTELKKNNSLIGNNMEWPECNTDALIWTSVP